MVPVIWCIINKNKIMMKYIFLVFGLCVGIFWSQVYEMASQLINTDFLGDQGVILSQVSALGSPKHGRDENKKANVKKVVHIVAKDSVDAKTNESAANYPDVIMYGTDWCPYCKKARTYFKSNGINFIEYDIEKNDFAKRMYDLLGGKGVPLILVHGKKLSGFDAQGFRVLYGK